MAKVIEMLPLTSFHGYVGIGFTLSSIPFIGFKFTLLRKHFGIKMKMGMVADKSYLNCPL